MPVQDTSIEAYMGLNLGERQKQVLEAFRIYGYHTNLEISKLIDLPINQITPRTNELVKMGWLNRITKRPCNISHKNAIVWGIIRN